MPHGAYIGQTNSGKTFGAQLAALEYRAAGVGVLALHKPREPWPAASVSWQTSDPDEFLRMFWASRSCACFMELADAEVDKHDRGFRKCFTQGVHEGHRCFYLSQRGAQVHPDIRENCESLCLFSVTMKAAKLWAEEFNDPLLLAAADLEPKDHYFYFKKRGREPARRRILHERRP